MCDSLCDGVPDSVCDSPCDSVCDSVTSYVTACMMACVTAHVTARVTACVMACVSARASGHHVRAPGPRDSMGPSASQCVRTNFLRFLKLLPEKSPPGDPSSPSQWPLLPLSRGTSHPAPPGVSAEGPWKGHVVLTVGISHCHQKASVPRRAIGWDQRTKQRARPSGLCVEQGCSALTAKK